MATEDIQSIRADEERRIEQELDRLDRRMAEVEAKQVKFQRAGFPSGSAVFVWSAFWEMAALHQDDPRFVILSWICVAAAVWVGGNM